MSYKVNKWLLWGLGVLLIYLSFAYLSNVILYIVLSIIVAFMGQPLVYLLSEKGLFKIKIPRAIASVLSLASLSFFLFLFVYLFTPLVSQQVQFFNSIDQEIIVERMEDKLTNVADQLESMGLWPKSEELEQIKEKALGFVSANRIGSYFGSALNFSANILITFFSVFFISFFLLKDAGLLNQIILSATPDTQLSKMQNAINNIRTLLSRYFLGLLIQVFVVSMVVYAGLSIVGVKNALVLGIIAGMFNLIPYIGPYIGAVFGILLGLTSELAVGSEIHFGYFSLKILMVYVVAQLTDNFVLQPLIFSKSVKAHPLEIFLVVLIAGTLFGVIGMIAAIPVYTILRVVAREFLPELKFVQKLTDKIKE